MDGGAGRGGAEMFFLFDEVYTGDAVLRAARPVWTRTGRSDGSTLTLSHLRGPWPHILATAGLQLGYSWATFWLQLGWGLERRYK